MYIVDRIKWVSMEPLIRSGKRFSGLLILLGLSISFAYPQTSQTTLFCTPSAVPPIVRSEGITERTGDILLDCTSGAPGATVKGNLTVFLNVSVTNKLLANSTTDVLLTVDTGAGPVPASVSAQPFAPNAVVFNGLMFTVPASGKVGLRITNLRGNASQLGPAPQLPIFAILSFNEGSALVTTNSQFTVAVTAPGLLTSFSSTGVRCVGSPLPSTINLGNLLAKGTIFFSTARPRALPLPSSPKIRTRIPARALWSVIQDFQPRLTCSYPTSWPAPTQSLRRLAAILELRLPAANTCRRQPARCC